MPIEEISFVRKLLSPVLYFVLPFLPISSISSFLHRLELAVLDPIVVPEWLGAMKIKPRRPLTSTLGLDPTPAQPHIDLQFPPFCNITPIPNPQTNPNSLIILSKRGAVDLLAKVYQHMTFVQCVASGLCLDQWLASQAGGLLTCRQNTRCQYRCVLSVQMVRLR